MDELVGAFFSSCSTSAAFEYALPETKPSYSPEDDVNVGSTVDVLGHQQAPPPLPKFAENFKSAEELWHYLPNYSMQEVAQLEEITRQQADCDLWAEHRKGTITASNADSVLTKYRGNKMSEGTSLLQNILGQDKVFDLPAFKYGRQNEPLAADCYLAHQQNIHKNQGKTRVRENANDVTAAAVTVAQSRIQVTQVVIWTGMSNPNRRPQRKNTPAPLIDTFIRNLACMCQRG